MDKGKLWILVVVGLLIFLISAGSQLGKGWSASEQMRASADAEYRSAQAAEVRQRTVDQNVLDEQTRAARAEATAVQVVGIALGLAGAVMIVGIGGGFWVVRRIKVLSLSPVESRGNDVVSIFLPSQRAGTPAVLLTYNPSLPLPLPTVVIDGVVTNYPKLRYEVARALIEGRTQSDTVRALSSAWQNVQNARERAEVLGQVMKLVESLGHPRQEVVNAKKMAEKMIEGESRPVLVSAVQR